jgi:hypothetical protein
MTLDLDQELHPLPPDTLGDPPEAPHFTLADGPPTVPPPTTQPPPPPPPPPPPVPGGLGTL